MAKTVLTARIVLDGPATKWEQELFDDAGLSPEELVNRVINVLAGYSTQGVRMQLQLDEAEPEAASLSFTVTQANLVAEETFRVRIPGELNSFVFTAVTSGADTSDFEFNIGANDTAAATSIAAAISASLPKLLSATSNSDNVTVSSVKLGSYYNDIYAEDLSTSNALSITTSSFSGGVEVLEEQPEVTVTVDQSGLSLGSSAVVIGNYAFTAVTAGDNDTELEWTGTGTDTVCATNLAAAISAHSALSGFLEVTSDSDVVTITPLVGVSPDMAAFFSDITVVSGGLTLSTNVDFAGSVTWTNRRANATFGKTVR